MYKADAAGPGCFAKCGAQSRNQSDFCWVNCFFKTMLGAKAGSAVTGSVASEGTSLQSVRSAWEAPFASEDPKKGGCPSY